MLADSRWSFTITAISKKVWYLDLWGDAASERLKHKMATTLDVIAAVFLYAM